MITFRFKQLFFVLVVISLPILLLIDTFLVYIPHIFSLVVLLIIAILVYGFFVRPKSLLHLFLFIKSGYHYRLKVIATNQIPSEGGVLLLGNHISVVDWVMILLSSTRKVHFVVNQLASYRCYERLLIYYFGGSFVSFANLDDLYDKINHWVKLDQVVAFFSQSDFVKDGIDQSVIIDFNRLVLQKDAVIIPFYLQGSHQMKSHQLSFFYRLTLRQTVYLGYGKPLANTIVANKFRQALLQVSILVWQTYRNDLSSIAKTWLLNAKAFKFYKNFLMIDSCGVTLSRNELMTAVCLYAGFLKKPLAKERNVAVLLPTGVAVSVINMALWCLGKTVVNLNYTTSSSNIAFMLAKAHVHYVITSTKFLKELAKRNLVFDSVLANYIVYDVDDIKKRQKLVKKLLFNLLVRFSPCSLLQRWFIVPTNSSEVATILFSSGSEGRPKGVKLTHQNLLINIEQIAIVFDLQKSDRLLSILPPFHAFGLTVCMLFPLICGCSVVSHPDPLDSMIVGRLVYGYQATILLGTPTFLNMYCRSKHLLPIMFHSLRLVISGGERLSPRVSDSFREKFSLSIYEGYGVTEASPVVSVNCPDFLHSLSGSLIIGKKSSTVGQALPGTLFRIVCPKTFNELPTTKAGLILIAGPQVMQGYLQDKKKPHDVLINLDGIRWYCSGDKGWLDANGFLTIVDRYARFAKIAAEMISLSAVELLIESVIQDDHIDIAVVAIADLKKGERLVLVYSGDLDQVKLRDQLKQHDVTPLMIPRDFLAVANLPKMASGKKDLQAIKQLVGDYFANLEENQGRDNCDKT